MDQAPIAKMDGHVQKPCRLGTQNVFIFFPAIF